jgi:hypothetical protein
MAVQVTRHLLTLVKEEKALLRTELQVLKECQIKFLTGAVVSAGVILGFPGVSEHGNNLNPDAYLVPLVILLPSWWGFFDKAKTITRIVGYFRILELIALVPPGGLSNDITRFLAWENSVSEYRQWERTALLKSINYGAKPRPLEVIKAVFLVPSQRYWSLANYTYATLCALCLIISFARLWETSNMYSLAALLMLAAAWAFGYTLIWNTSIWWELMWGRHSYRATEAYWRHILTHQR